jgi:hypothetical protein
LAYAQQNPVAVKRAERDSLQNEKIEGSWKKLGFAGHASLLR